ncbi:MAG: hypothetical protein RIC29_02070 [Rhodospirillaceae bacterium]
MEYVVFPAPVGPVTIISLAIAFDPLLMQTNELRVVNMDPALLIPYHWILESLDSAFFFLDAIPITINTMPMGISSALSLPRMLGNMNKTPLSIQSAGAYLFKMAVPFNQFSAFSTTFTIAGISTRLNLDT